jgi:hypothetical protein
MPSQGLGQRDQLGVGQRIVDDDQQVDVAAAREVVVQGQGAVEEHPGDVAPSAREQARASASANRRASLADAVAAVVDLAERLGGIHALSHPRTS